MWESGEGGSVRSGEGGMVGEWGGREKEQEGEFNIHV